jgi:hypothetical protein
MQDIEKDKLRKVVINSVRKSIMAGGGIMNTMAQQSLIANMA